MPSMHNIFNIGPNNVRKCLQETKKSGALMMNTRFTEKIGVIRPLRVARSRYAT